MKLFVALVKQIVVEIGGGDVAVGRVRGCDIGAIGGC